MASFCGVLDLGQSALRQVHQTYRARRIVYRAGDETEDIDVICDGWAASSVRLSDGRQQILSFLIPGDLVSVATVFEKSQFYSVQSLTDLRCCKFSRAELQNKLTENPKVFERLVACGMAEKQLADQTIVSLGRRNAAARIARLILSFMERLKARGLAHGQSFDFPLRQQQIGDAMGLTTVHVSRVINMFRKEGLIEIAQRQMKILNLSELRRVADER